MIKLKFQIADYYVFESEYFIEYGQEFFMMHYCDVHGLDYDDVCMASVDAINAAVSALKEHQFVRVTH